MKKFILFLSIFIGSINLASAQNDSIPKVTFETVYTDFKGAVQGISESLKVGAEHVYYVLVKQQIIKSINYILITLSGLLLLFIAVRFLNWVVIDFKDWQLNRKRNSMDDYFHWKIVAGTIFFIIGFILFMIGVGHYDTILTGIFNPEYGAIEDIANFVRH